MRRTKNVSPQLFIGGNLFWRRLFNSSAEKQSEFSQIYIDLQIYVNIPMKIDQKNSFLCYYRPKKLSSRT